MRIGIDQSLSSTGIVAVHEGEVVFEELIKTTPTQRKKWGEIDTLHHICDRVSDIVCELQDQYALEAVILEEPPAHIGGAAKRILIGLFYALRLRLPLTTSVNPKTLKKAFCRNGGASKDEMIAEANKRGFETDSDDLADAYALATIPLG